MRSRLTLLLIGLTLSVSAGAAAQTAGLAERAAAIDSVLAQQGGFRVVVGHISRELGIPVETLREQQTKTGLGWGDLLIAHRVSREGKAGVEQVVADFQGGKSWEDIARDYKVDLAKLGALVERSQVTVERRSEDRAPPNTGTGPVAAPPGGAGRGLLGPSKY